MTAWIIVGIIYALGAITFFKLARDSRWIRAAFWPLFVIFTILFL
jgi:hypothetical protein